MDNGDMGCMENDNDGDIIERRRMMVKRTLMLMSVCLMVDGLSVLPHIVAS